MRLQGRAAAVCGCLCLKQDIFYDPVKLISILMYSIMYIAALEILMTGDPFP